MILYERLEGENDIFKKLSLWRTKRDQWLSYAEECEEFYYNDVEGTRTIFNQKQYNIIKEMGDIPISINRVYPNTSQAIAILKKAKSYINVQAYDDRGVPFVPTLNKILNSVLYSNEALAEEEEIIKDIFIKGIGIAGIVEQLDYKVGKLPFKYKRINHSNIILDPNTRERDLSDMTGYFMEKVITKEQAKKYYQPLLDAVNKKYNADLNFDNMNTMLPTKDYVIDTEAKVNVLEYYDKIYTNMYFIRDVDTNDILRVFEENLEEDQKFILSGAEDVELNTFVRRRLIIGNYLLLEEVLLITDFPIAVKFFDWRGRIYDSYGFVHFIKDMQYALTKFIQLAIVNGILTNNAGWLVPEGSIRREDEEKWEKMGNRPGVIKKYIPQIIDGNLLKPEREPVQSLSDFYPYAIQLVLTGMDSVSGVNNVIRGEPNPNIEVFSTLRTLQEAAMYRLEAVMDHITTPVPKIGEVLVEYILNSLRGDLKYILLNPNNEYEAIFLGKENLPALKMAKYFVVPVLKEALPTRRLAQASEMFKIAQSTADPVTREVLIAESLKMSGIADGEKILEKIDFIRNMESRLQEAMEQIKRLQEINKQLENRIIRAEITNKVLLAVKNGGMEEENIE